MIVFDDQAALDAYVRRVLAAYFTVCETAIDNAVEAVSREENMPPAAVTLVRGGAKITQAVYRGSLTLPLPVVTR